MLDASKMNRAVFLTRPQPALEDLEITARAIVSESEGTGTHIITDQLKAFARAYSALQDKQHNFKYRNFFGLRDFYSFVKSLVREVKKDPLQPLSHETVVQLVLRNFSGVRTEDLRPLVLDCFRMSEAPSTDPGTLVREALLDKHCRHVMVLMESESAQSVQLLKSAGITPAASIVILGSPFPDDNDDTHVFENINLIRNAMEAGRTVVLVKIAGLEESLYDMFNQAYTHFCGNQFCRIALGGESRTACVHPDFRCMVIKLAVDAHTNKIPPPLLNRFEKQLVTSAGLLGPGMANMVVELQRWCEVLVQPVALTAPVNMALELESLVVGWSPELIPRILLGLQHQGVSRDNLMFQAQAQLVWLMTPAGLIRARSRAGAVSSLAIEAMYCRDQRHGSLPSLLTWLAGQCPGGIRHVLFTYYPIGADTMALLAPTGFRARTLNLHSQLTEDRVRRELLGFFTSETETLLFISAAVSTRYGAEIAYHARGLWEEVCMSESGKLQGTKHVVFLAHVSRPRLGAGLLPILSTSNPNGLHFGREWTHSFLDHWGSPSTLAMAGSPTPVDPAIPSYGSTAGHAPSAAHPTAGPVAAPDSLDDTAANLMELLARHQVDMIDIFQRHRVQALARLQYHPPLANIAEVQTRCDQCLQIPSFFEAFATRLHREVGNEHDLSAVIARIAEDPHSVARAGSFVGALQAGARARVVDCAARIWAAIDRFQNLESLKVDYLVPLWIQAFRDDQFTPIPAEFVVLHVPTSPPQLFPFAGALLERSARIHELAVPLKLSASEHYAHIRRLLLEGVALPRLLDADVVKSARARLFSDFISFTRLIPMSLVHTDGKRLIYVCSLLLSAMTPLGDTASAIDVVAAIQTTYGTVSDVLRAVVELLVLTRSDSAEFIRQVHVSLTDYIAKAKLSVLTTGVVDLPSSNPLVAASVLQCIVQAACAHDALLPPKQSRMMLLVQRLSADSKRTADRFVAGHVQLGRCVERILEAAQRVPALLDPAEIGEIALKWKMLRFAFLYARTLHELPNAELRDVITAGFSGAGDSFYHSQRLLKSICSTKAAPRSDAKEGCEFDMTFLVHRSCLLQPCV